MSIGLIVIGDEILSGKRQDKHMAEVIRMLAKRGLALAWARYVGDDPARITADLRDALAAARERGEVIFSCGGIGATPDDHTRACAAQALGVPLELHPEARELIVERMREMAAERGVAYEPELAENRQRLNMGLFPQGAEIIPNPYNKIPGFALRQPGAGGLYFVPGFPVMAWPMIEWVLDHHHAHLHGQAVTYEHSLIVMGVMEATLTPLMERIEAEHPGVKVFSLPSVDHPQWGRHIELGVKGPDPGAAAGAYRALKAGLAGTGAKLGPEMVHRR